MAIDDPAAWADEESVEDDRLRLIFTCLRQIDAILERRIAEL